MFLGTYSPLINAIGIIFHHEFYRLVPPSHFCSFVHVYACVFVL